MTTALTYLLLMAVLLAPFGLIAAVAALAHRDGHLRWRLNQFRLSAPMVGNLFEDSDADLRRLSHDLDAVRTRFERQPSWPQSGAVGERR
ncbi:hypothetical protein [Mycolicibacterium mengxianglii]|uniref:hypothetical protein n=1 Tax=Mycolicibacterium mengxianglii TaxID=2736649 RepID=UPI0018D07C8B|nr:hypothetical protein [Mycolicibacterium mengxianglii]